MEVEGELGKSRLGGKAERSSRSGEVGGVSSRGDSCRDSADEARDNGGDGMGNRGCRRALSR